MKTEDEKVLELLADAWNAYLESRPECKSYMVPVGNGAARKSSLVDDDLIDFRKAIHDAQRIVMARAWRNQTPEKYNHTDKPSFPKDREDHYP